MSVCYYVCLYTTKSGYFVDRLLTFPPILCIDRIFCIGKSTLNSHLSLAIELYEIKICDYEKIKDVPLLNIHDCLSVKVSLYRFYSPHCALEKASPCETLVSVAMKSPFFSNSLEL